MKAVRVHGPDDVRIDEIATPVPGPNDVVVRVAASGICGSDFTYVATGGVSGPAGEPFGLGHEFAGVVEAVGDAVERVTPGMRVIVNPMGDGNGIGNGAPEGAFAPHLLVRNATLGSSILPIPDDMPFDRAALAEPLSVALHAVNRANPSPDDKIAVFGAGPIGLGILFFLLRRGITDVVAIDMSDDRLARARALGARHTLNPARDDIAEALGAIHGTGTLFGWPVIGSNLFIEASGGAPVIPQIIGMAPFASRLIVVAVHHKPVPVDFQMALGKEMTITTSCAYPNEFPAVIEALADPNFDIAPMVSHRFALDDFMEAFATARDKDRSAKVLITFDQ
jgi:2-desacetyl-2-hydroxyethyl bacteriochlorophyllide A dehydrogenase